MPKRKSATATDTSQPAPAEEQSTPVKRPRRTKAHGGIEHLSAREVDDIAKFSVKLVTGTVVAEAIKVEEVSTPAKKRRSNRKKTDPVAEATQQESTPASAKRKRTPKAKAAVPAEPDTPGTAVSIPRRSSRARKVLPSDAYADCQESAPEDTPTKRRRRRKADEPVTYVIPPVERLQTTFHGRLGYACLNTVLRQLPEPVFCSRTCRLDTLRREGVEFAKELGLRNVEDLGKMIEWNEANKIKFMRVSSDMFPFASHGEHGYSLEYADSALRAAGALAKKYGHRLTMHPGQFTQLGSPKPGVVAASVRELEHQCDILDRLGVGRDGVMIIHMGGVYGDKPGTIARFKQNWRGLSEKVRDRLVLENDELCYNVEELLPVSEELGVPIVLDWHHDWIYPSSQSPAELMPRILSVWQQKGIKPKQHLSEPRPGAVSVVEKRAHADRCERLPEGMPGDMDLMIEAKDKEQAVFHLWRIYGLEEPLHENLRPPKEVQELATNGRKARKVKKCVPIQQPL
ncbi:UV-endonuclease UvdE [Calocera cornea HHB12733]|uniref:UV-endonuclease UvdE n=1 Tax=Calocera cornea HHB12733 TaxID=1353952 RepID=A0A165DR46_9BASI|nr:UV-endonuclease UvdE [Calocera cornea HHB12733]